MHKKDFRSWIALKEAIDRETERPGVRKGEIRWCAIGHNVGSEIDGKGTLFGRPVIVLQQLSPNTAFVLPLTHSAKAGAFVYEFEFQGEQIKARLDQARVVDLKRLKAKVGELSTPKLEELKRRAIAFLFGLRVGKTIHYADGRWSSSEIEPHHAN